MSETKKKKLSECHRAALVSIYQAYLKADTGLPPSERYQDSIRRDLNNPEMVAIIADNVVQQISRLSAERNSFKDVLEPLCCYVEDWMERRK